MKRSLWMLWLTFSLPWLAGGGYGLYGQSIDDAAKKERARREQARAHAKVLTEEDLKAVSSDPDRSGRRAAASEAGVGEGRRGEQSVPFVLRGNSMIVQATVNNRAQTRLILDTGASMTSLSRSMAEAAGISVSDKNIHLPMQTANGITMAPMVRLSSLQIGDVVVRDLDAVLLSNWPDAEVTGLLGMNVLNQFSWQIDATQSRIVLKPNRKPPDKETYGGYEKEWWSGQFRFLREVLEQWQGRLSKATRAEEADQIKSAIEKLEAQLDTLTREANRAGVPPHWRR